jgi:hypothetical protein
MILCQSEIRNNGNKNHHARCRLIPRAEELRLNPQGMRTVRTLDRTLALKCKQARTNGERITVRYETPGGWNHVTGVIESVQRRQARPLRPFWEITIIEQRG